MLDKAKLLIHTKSYSFSIKEVEKMLGVPKEWTLNNTWFDEEHSKICFTIKKAQKQTSNP